ncbi:uncharacterized protein LOC110973506 isoform X2 [Acanthaster planci]|uniref:Uncharacterized protein LOC110973506 isoform X2 n=1 Tax=Acanthaster planci TaxID=133434 RepID=A0A8B7XIW8_ACAPL|nr:uncharacterized protein LOC110973506 isoform X2 [Acanthaster planci]
MDVDSSLKIVGLCSWVQLINLATFGLHFSLGALQLTAIALTIDQSVEHYCKPPSGFTVNETAPLINRINDQPVRDGCHMYVVFNRTLTDNVTSCQNGWEYPRVELGETNTLTDFDLVCGRNVLASTLMSLHFAGSLAGSFLTGQAADLSGRRPVAVICLVLMIILGTAISFTWNLELMLALRFLLGLVLPGNTMVAYNRIVEMFTPKKRVMGNMVAQYFWTFGVIMVAPIGALLPNWRNFQLATSLGGVPFLLLYWLVTYESLRWLVQKGRLHDAEAILKKIAKSRNIAYEGSFLAHQEEEVPLSKKTVPREEMLPEESNGQIALSLQQDDKEVEGAFGGIKNRSSVITASVEDVDGNLSYGFIPKREDEKKDEPTTGIMTDESPSSKEGSTVVSKDEGKSARRYTIFDLFKTRLLMKNTLIIFYLWFAMDIMYFEILVYATSFTGNKYLNFFLLSVVEAPVYIHDYFLARRFGCRRPIAVFFLASAVCFILIAFLPAKIGDTDLAVMIIVVAMIGKFYVNAAYELTMLVGAEIFPTVLRNIGQGSGATVGRVGTIIAPFFLLLKNVVNFLPMTILALMSVVASLCVLLLPETKNRPLPEKYEDSQKLARNP